jgi:dihydropteroate synthase
MGIVNVTPDSFSDGGRYFEPAMAVEQALRMVEEGADLIDVGGESSRPGAMEVSAREEADRILPVLEGIRRHSSVPISIDTTKSAVGGEALAAGGDLINDISAGAMDADMLALVAGEQVPYIAMHMQGTPRTMQANPRYDDVLAEVCAFLEERARQCEAMGIRQVILDPGIGFGKTLRHNLALLAGLDRLVGLGRPVLLGVSRKSFIGAITGADAHRRLGGGIAASVLALRQGVRMFRTHDVAESRNALDVATAILAGKDQEDTDAV